MSAAQSAPTSSRPDKPRARLVAPASKAERRFWIAFGCALFVHSLIVIGIATGTLVSEQAQKRLGEEKGNPEGVSVVIVDLADLESKTTVAPNSAAQPPQPPAPPIQPTPPQPKAQREVQPQPQAQPEPPAETSPLPTPPLEGPGEGKPPPKQKQAVVPQQPARPAAPAAPSRPAAPPTLVIPDIAIAPGRMAPAASRPPGITRSGENDEFGRNVIMALARVMPRLDIRGRVTVSILLNEKGNLAEVKVLRPSDDPVLDRNVTFSVKQANFPIPPDRSTVVDRTFYVTYIYR